MHPDGTAASEYQYGQNYSFANAIIANRGLLQEKMNLETDETATMHAVTFRVGPPTHTHTCESRAGRISKEQARFYLRELEGLESRPYVWFEQGPVTIYYHYLQPSSSPCYYCMSTVSQAI